MIEKVCITKTGELLWKYIDEAVEVENNQITITNLNAFKHIPKTFGFELNNESEVVDILINYIGEYGYYNLGLENFIVLAGNYKINFNGLFVTSINDNPAMEISTLKNVPFSKRWYKDGVLHRDGDKPSIMEKIPVEHHLRLITWHKNGVLHRDNSQPALLEFWGQKQIAKASWYENGIMKAVVNFKQKGDLHSIITDGIMSDSFYFDKVSSLDINSKTLLDELELHF